MGYLKSQWQFSKPKAERSERTEITVDRVIKELAGIAFASISDAIEWGPDGVVVKSSVELSPEVLAAVNAVTETRHKNGTVAMRLRMHDKLAALHKVADHLGLFPKRVQVDVQSTSYIIEQTLAAMTDDQLDALIATGRKRLETGTTVVKGEDE